MLERLEQLQKLRGSLSMTDGRDAAFHARVKAVKLWQQARLARTYADLAADDRFAPAVSFFLTELYGDKDSTLRDRDLVRMYPTIKRLLPKFAFDAVSKALELDVLAEEFDQALTTALGMVSLTEASYLKAFRAVGRREDRIRQIALMRAVGEGLDKMVKKPLIFSTLKMLRGPAKVAGLGEMQQFLEAGFTAFRHMDGADDFLAIVASRETILVVRILNDEDDPFSPIRDWTSKRR
ncbi:MAG: hypothetical protein ABL931_24350 [Usitatibacteraceae bacterium]